MKHNRGQLIDVDSVDEFDRRLSAHPDAAATSTGPADDPTTSPGRVDDPTTSPGRVDDPTTSTLTGWRIHGLDLRERTETVLGCRVSGSLFLGCTFAPGVEQLITDRGGLIFPTVPETPVTVDRQNLYTAGELYGDGAYPVSLDARTYAWSQQPPTEETALAERLHDHSVSVALEEWVRGRRIAGVMGGHAVHRGTPPYAQAALLGQLATVATGGGPGAMEAANLGSRLAVHDRQVLDSALRTVAEVPSFAPDIGAWSAAAFEVIGRFAEPVESLGIPTWHYGHEPPNPFPTAIAKFFGNPVREAVLLEICNAGIVFLPGAAGTVQEIFADACENYYAHPSALAPMILVDTHHWTEVLPVWPLLRALAADRAMQDRIHLVDTVEEAAELIIG
ncbi:LOG family protein [Naumannella halotolerans]|uniref:Putative Rossmann-fold nucleotide-binding protein n=1 Tax=Naumannella halotolerans TaxID=993414 RepID=A0A4R7J8M3_9ACTN|nr:LOG family protein [Naumannella halotolerans]TDT32887.1 putative Rossmann-fold nucleotide-binding protein [Naumannella halotolerans]